MSLLSGAVTAIEMAIEAARAAKSVYYRAKAARARAAKVTFSDNRTRKDSGGLHA